MPKEKKSYWDTDTEPLRIGDIEQSTPGRLLDALNRLLRCRTDRQLAMKLFMEQERISRVRSGKRKITAGMLLRMHDVSGMPVNEMRKLMGAEIPRYAKRDSDGQDKGKS